MRKRASHTCSTVSSRTNGDSNKWEFSVGHASYSRTNGDFLSNETIFCTFVAIYSRTNGDLAKFLAQKTKMGPHLFESLLYIWMWVKIQLPPKHRTLRARTGITVCNQVPGEANGYLGSDCSCSDRLVRSSTPSKSVSLFVGISFWPDGSTSNVIDLPGVACRTMWWVCRMRGLWFESASCVRDTGMMRLMNDKTFIQTSNFIQNNVAG